jgi:hypothetical protein
MSTTQDVRDDRTVGVERAVAFGLLAAVGGYAFVVSFGYQWFVDQGRVGPGLVPGVIGGLVAVVSLAMVVTSLRGPKRAEAHGLAEVVAAATEQSPDPDTDENGDDVDIFGRTARQRVHQLWMVTAALVVTLSLVGYIGLLMAFLLFCLFASIVVERRPWLTSLVITAISIAAVYYVFAVFLEVPLPTGYLGIGG